MALAISGPGTSGTVLPDVPGRGASAQRTRNPAIASRAARPNLGRVKERYWVYILASRRNGTLYAGVTSDLMRRTLEHKERRNPGFASRYGVDRLVWFEEYASIIQARGREHALKKWRRAWKLALIEETNPDWDELEPPMC